MVAENIPGPSDTGEDGPSLTVQSLSAILDVAEDGIAVFDAR